MEDLVAAVRTSLADETRAIFDRRVADQAAAVRADLEDGRLDNPGFATGLELEAYAVDEQGRLADVPASVFELAGCDAELGVHNVEIHTPADALDGQGLRRQAECVRERVRSVRRRLRETGRHLVLDGMWTVPPPDGTRSYLGATVDHDGVVVAENMRADPRYVAIDNEVRRRAGGDITFAVPGYEGRFPSMLLESLASSIQPHLQVPDAASFPAYFNTALRTAGPLLALTANSPFLPGDLYAGDAGPGSGDPTGEDALDVVESTHHELRIAAFEQSINVADPEGKGKVRFPRDVETTTEVVDRLVADPTYAPELYDDAPADYAERHPELAHKRGTFWRWVRAVIGGQQPRGGEGGHASIRIEYRPLPTQPTLADIVACQALVCGLVRGLVAADHPIRSLPWGDARDGFYAATRSGLDAELPWVAADGTRTTDTDVIFEEVFAYARRGLEAGGLASDHVDELLAPLVARWDRRLTPSTWKRELVRERVAEGESLSVAITAMQRRYVERAMEHETFVGMAD